MWFIYLCGFILCVVALALYKTHVKLNKEYGDTEDDDDSSDSFMNKMMMF